MVEHLVIFETMVLTALALLCVYRFPTVVIRIFVCYQTVLSFQSFVSGPLWGISVTK